MRSFIICTPPDIIKESRKMRWTGYVARMGYMRNAYTILVGKSEGKRQFLGTAGRINIKMDHRRIWCENLDWINLSLVNTGFNTMWRIS
jgi:hypothetical protein